MKIATILWCTVLMLAMMAFCTTQGCWRPSKRCQCGFRDYPCINGYSYGCYYGYCWSQCAAILGGCREWCYVKSESTGNYRRCSSNSDCGAAADCSLSECSGGCSLFKRDSISNLPGDINMPFVDNDN